MYLNIISSRSYRYEFAKIVLSPAREHDFCKISLVAWNLNSVKQNRKNKLKICEKSFKNRVNISTKIDSNKEHPKSRFYKPVLVREREARFRVKSLRALRRTSCKDPSRLQQCWRASSNLTLFPSPSAFALLWRCAAASTSAMLWDNI